MYLGEEMPFWTALRRDMEILEAHPGFQEFWEEAKILHKKQEILELRTKADRLEKEMMK